MLNTLFIALLLLALPMVIIATVFMMLRDQKIEQGGRHAWFWYIG